MSIEQFVVPGVVTLMSVFLAVLGFATYLTRD